MELNEKLARWAGFDKRRMLKSTSSPGDGCVTQWVQPDGTATRRPPNFTESLDACFKRLESWGYICGVEFRFYPGILRCIITVQDEGGFTAYIGEVLNEPPYKKLNIEKSALALCMAIEQLKEAT